MSRSYRKHPHSDPCNRKDSKKEANRIVRHYKGEMTNGSWYKKMYFKSFEELSEGSWHHISIDQVRRNIEKEILDDKNKLCPWWMGYIRLNDLSYYEAVIFNNKKQYQQQFHKIIKPN